MGMLSLNEMLVYTPDSGRYLAWANSLANFDGFIDRTAPEPIRYVVHAPLYPLLLAPAALVMPKNVIAAKIVTLLIGTAFLALFYTWTKHKTSELIALAGTALLAINPLVLIYSTQVLSEMPFAVAVVLFFLWNEKLTEQNVGNRDRREWLLLSSIVCGLFLREIGLTLLLSAVGFYLLRKEYRRALLLLSGSLILYALWYLRNEVWVAGIEHPSIRNTKIFFQHLYTSNSATLTQELWGRLLANAAVYKNYVGKLIFMPDFIPRSHRMISPTDLDVRIVFAMLRVLQYPIIVSTLAFFAFGCWRVWIRRTHVVLYGLFALCYLGPILLYPINDIRFMLPLLILLVHVSAIGIHDLMDGSYGWFSAAVGKKILLGSLMILSVPNLVWARSFITNGRAYASDAKSFAANAANQARSPEQFTLPFHLVGKWIAEHSAPNDAIICRWKELFFWMNGQKVIAFDPEIVPESFDNLVRDYRATYLVSVVSTKYLREFEVLINMSSRFRFETVYRIGNVEVLKILPKDIPHPVVQEEGARSSSDSIRADFAHALALLNTNAAAQAESLFQSITNRIGTFGPVILYAGIAKEFAGSLDAAESSLQHFRTQPQAGSFVQDAWYHLEIIARLRAANSKQNPSERAAKFNELAVNYRELGFKKQSYTMLTRSLESDSLFFPSLILTGVFFLQDGQMDSARKFLRAARRIDSTNTLARHLWEIAHYPFDSPPTDRATQLSRRLVAARLFEECGMREDAIDMYLAVLREAPANESALRNLSAIYEIKLRYSLALEYTIKLLERRSSDAALIDQQSRLRSLLWD